MIISKMYRNDEKNEELEKTDDLFKRRASLEKVLFKSRALQESRHTLAYVKVSTKAWSGMKKKSISGRFNYSGVTALDSVHDLRDNRRDIIRLSFNDNFP